MEKLDLHGVKHEDVRRKVINFVEGSWNCPHDLEIITGYSVKMKGLVTTILNEYKVSYTEGTYLDSTAPKIIVWGGDEV